jgi:hypothetical protein
MVHVGEAEEEDDDGGCWRGSPGVDRADVKRFGWRQLAITLMKKRCFQCGAQPSFVVFLDNTRKCQKCISTEKLRREVEETKRWEHELKHQQSEDEDEGNEHEDDAEQQAKRMKTTLCTEESKQKRRAVKVSRRLTRCVRPTGQSQLLGQVCGSHLTRFTGWALCWAKRASMPTPRPYCWRCLRATSPCMGTTCVSHRVSCKQS